MALATVGSGADILEFDGTRCLLVFCLCMSVHGLKDFLRDIDITGRFKAFEARKGVGFADCIALVGK